MTLSSRLTISKMLTLALVSSSLVLLAAPQDQALASTPLSSADFSNGTCELTSAGYLGDGSSANPYQLTDADSLWESSDCSIVASVAQHFVLMNDIAASQAVNAPTHSPIGYSVSGAVPFSGVLDGDGYSITDIAISTSNATGNGVGLFWKLDNAEVKKLAMSGSVTHSGADFNVGTGGLAGQATSVTLSDVTNSVEVFGFFGTGGLIGEVTGDLIVSNSSNTATISGRTYVGGIIGTLDTNGSLVIVESRNNGNIYAFDTGFGSTSIGTAGGFVGRSSASVTTFSNLVNVGTVESSGNTAGGLAGQVNKAAVIDSVNSGQVSGLDSVGGLIGSAVNATVINSTNSGGVSGSNYVGGLIGGSGDVNLSQSNNVSTVSGAADVGGLLGWVGTPTVFESHNKGIVQGAADRVGGLVGYADNEATFTKSYNVATVSGAAYVAGLLGYGQKAVVFESFNRGAIEGDGDYVSGLVAYSDGSPFFLNSFNYSSVSGSNHVSGLVSYGDGISPEFQNVFSSGTITGILKDGLSPPFSSNVFAPTTQSAYSSVDTLWLDESTLVEMQSVDLYLNWDFSSNGVWGFGECSEFGGLPLLRFAAEVSTYYDSGCGVGGSGGTSTPEVGAASGNASAAPPSYEGPLAFASSLPARAGETVIIPGTRLNLVTSAYLGAVQIEIIRQSDDELLVLVPATASYGLIDLVLHSSYGRLTVIKAILVAQTQPASTPSLSEEGEKLLGKSRFIPMFSSNQKSLAQKHELWLKTKLEGSGLTKLVCTGVIDDSMTTHQKIVTKKRAIETCKEAAKYLEESTIRYQTKVTDEPIYIGKVLITFWR